MVICRKVTPHTLKMEDPLSQLAVNWSTTNINLFKCKINPYKIYKNRHLYQSFIKDHELQTNMHCPYAPIPSASGFGVPKHILIGYLVH